MTENLNEQKTIPTIDKPLVTIVGVLGKQGLSVMSIREKSIICNN